jgi:hypothetical protein
MTRARRRMSRAPPPTAMPTMAPVLRTGEVVAVAGELVVDMPDEEAVFEVDVGREVIEVGDAEVAEVEGFVDDTCLPVSSREYLEMKKWNTEDDVDDGTAVIVAARNVASGSLSGRQENQRNVGELEAIQVCQWQ